MMNLSTERDVRAAPLRKFVAPAVALIIILSGVFFVWSGVVTASARFSASTSNESSFISAAAIDLNVDAGEDAASTGLLIDAAGLYPGLRIERCFVVSYTGALDDVPVRLFGRAGGGTGLEAYIDATIEQGAGSDNQCSDFTSSGVLFDDTLRTLWDRHGSFAAGLPIIEAADDGSSAWVRISIEVVDDNDAQDLTTAFWLTLEARP